MNFQTKLKLVQAGYKNPTIQVYMIDLKDPDGDMDAYLIPTPQEVLDWGEHYLYTTSWANELVFSNTDFYSS